MAKWRRIRIDPNGLVCHLDLYRSVSGQEAGFLTRIDAEPRDRAHRCAYADWLEEQGRLVEAAAQRDAAGLTEARWRLASKETGRLMDPALVWAKKFYAEKRTARINARNASHRERGLAVREVEVEVVLVEYAPRVVTEK